MLDKIIVQIIGKPAPVGADKPNKPKTESSIGGNRLWSLLASIKSWFESMPGIFFRCTKKPSDTVDPNKIIVVNKNPVGNVDKIEAVVKGPQVEVVKEPQEEVVKEPQEEVVKGPQVEVVKEPQVEVVKEPQKKVVKRPQVEVVKGPQKKIVKRPQKNFVTLFNELKELNIMGPDDVTKGLNLINEIRAFGTNNVDNIRDLERIHQNLHMAGQVYSRW